MIRLLLRAAPARFRAAPALSLLPVFAIALGVAAVLSIQLVNRAALDTLDASLEAVSGASDLRLEGLVLEPGAVPDRVWPEALAVPGVESASPVVRLRRVSLAAGERRASAEAYGVDLLSTGFAFAEGGSAPEGAATPLFDSPAFFSGGITLPASLAARLGVSLGREVTVAYGDRSREAPVAGIYGDSGSGGSGDGGGRGGPAFLDLAYAQALRGRAGLDRIEIRLAPDAEAAAVAEALRGRFPGVRVAEPSTLRREGADLLAAFRLNLTALSAVSLLVGAFLVYASVRAGLAARRREIGLYRALGAPSGSVGLALAGEVALASLLGGAFGLPLGLAAARAGLDRVSATMTNFYLLERIEELAVTPGVLAASLAVGLAAALAGAWPEIRSEIRRPPVSLLAPGREPPGGGRRPYAAAAFGVLLVGLSALPLLFPGETRFSLGGGFPAAGALVVGAALLPAGALSLFGPRLRRFGHRSAFGRGAAAALREPSATAPAAAALVVAVTMLVGVTVLVGSFRRTLETWLRETLAADIYVSRFGDLGGGVAERLPLPPEALAAIEADPAVEHRDLLRGVRVQLAGRPVAVNGIEIRVPRSTERFSLVGGGEAPMEELLEGAALVSEVLARRLGLAAGGALELPTAAGPVSAPVAGVYRDYGNQTGALFLDGRWLDRLYPPPRSPDDPAAPPPVHGAALYLRPGEEAAVVAARLRAVVPDGVGVVDRGALRGAATRVFDQTMAVTRLLRAFALGIAALGVSLLLLTMARERVAEIALFRALGADSGQVGAGFLGRGALIALAALVLGGGAGALLALLLVEVVNPAWFGWTLELSWPVGALSGQGALVLAAGLAAAALPARLAARSGGAAALGEEV